MRKIILALLFVPIVALTYIRSDKPEQAGHTPLSQKSSVDESFDRLLDTMDFEKGSNPEHIQKIQDIIRTQQRLFQSKGQDKALIYIFTRLLETIDKHQGKPGLRDLLGLLRNEVGLIKPLLENEAIGLRILSSLSKSRDIYAAQVLAGMLGSYLLHPGPTLRKEIGVLLSRSGRDQRVLMSTQRLLYSSLEQVLSKTPSFVPIALKQLANKDAAVEVRRQIVAVLHEAGKTEHRANVVETLIALAEQSRGDESDLRDMAIRSLGRMGSVDSLSRLLPLLRKHPEDLELHRSMAVALPFFAQSPEAKEHMGSITKAALNALNTEGLGKTAYKHAIRVIKGLEKSDAIKILRPYSARQDQYIGPYARKALLLLESATNDSKQRQ